MPHQLVVTALLKDKFRLQTNTVQAFQGEICHYEIFKFLLKTLLRESFTVKPWKNRKNSRAYSVRTRGTSGSNYPPFQGNVQIPPSPGTMHSQMPGGMLKLHFGLKTLLLWKTVLIISSNFNYQYY